MYLSTAMENAKYKILTGALLLFSIIMFATCIGCGGGDVSEEEAEELFLEVEDSLVVGDSAFSGKPNKISYFNRRRAFNDMNDTHLAAAKQIGIKPLASRAGIHKASRKLYLICSNMGFIGPEPYVVDRLTHSTPFLVKEAADLLYEIGVNFQDSLKNKHLPAYSIVITSVLRTDADVKSLSKRNINASKRSVHCYGTTFDISYKRFVKLDKNAPDARDIDLIAVLSEVLRDLKKQGRCYVKHEVKQACFHTTARKRK